MEDINELQNFSGEQPVKLQKAIINTEFGHVPTGLADHQDVDSLRKEFNDFKDRLLSTLKRHGIDVEVD